MSTLSSIVSFYNLYMTFVYCQNVINDSIKMTWPQVMWLFFRPKNLKLIFLTVPWQFLG